MSEVTPPALPRAKDRALPLWGVIGLCCLVEVLLLSADHGLVGSARWRPLSYQYGGFWAGLLRNWQPNYAVQPALMFVTYAFLHIGLSHLLGNMLGLWALGQTALDRLGARGFLALYAISAFGAALAFGLLSSSPAPMVGASGAIFGLAGAWIVWDRQQRRRTGLWDRSALLVVAGVGVNIAMWWVASGQLAWEAHLGGTIAGTGFAIVSPRLAKTRS